MTLNCPTHLGHKLGTQHKLGCICLKFVFGRPGAFHESITYSKGQNRRAVIRKLNLHNKILKATNYQSKFERSGLFSTTQFAYRKGLGTCDALLCMSHTLQRAVESGQKTRIVFIDSAQPLIGSTIGELCISSVLWVLEIMYCQYITFSIKSITAP